MAGHVPEYPVAFFEIWSRSSPDEQFHRQGEQLDIFPNWNGYIGRGADCCIIFEDDPSSGIPPLVYVQDFSTNGTFLTRHGTQEEQRISRRDDKILLQAGDLVRISPNLTLKFYYSAIVPPDANKLPKHVCREAELFADRYTITNQIIGSGGNGKVYVAIHKKTNKQLACKVVDMGPYGLDIEDRGALRDVTNIHTGSPVARRQKQQLRRDSSLDSQQFREFDILQHLDHPNIVHLEKVFWSHNTIFIFQDLITGGDLFSYVQNWGGALPNVDAAVIMHQLLKGIEHLHDRNIVHRDLKPDNVLISSSNSAPLRAIITDFGACQKLEPGPQQLVANSANTAKKRMTSFMGTLEYVAPEIYDTRQRFTRGYTKAVDIWSVGIILTMLLTGDVIWRPSLYLPIPGVDKKEEIGKLVQACDLSMLDDPKSVWSRVDKRAKDFVRKILVVDETQRLDVKQALAHSWFTNKYCGEKYDTVYHKAINTWQPRRQTFRVIEKLDLTRLKPIPQRDDAARSQYFDTDYAVPFPQGQLYASPLRSPSTARRGPLATIGEEATPEPETPEQSPILPPLSPRARKPPRSSSSSMRDVDNSLNQLGLDSRFDVMEDDDQHMGDESFDLDAPVRRTPPPKMGAFYQEASDAVESVAETPPAVSKRIREDLDETYDSSIEVTETTFTAVNKFTKKARLFR